MVHDSFLHQYLGEWQDETGNRLIIELANHRGVSVTFLSAATGRPVARPWCHDKLSIDMRGHFDPDEALSIEVELCRERPGFVLDLTFEPEYLLDPQCRNALVPGLVRFEEDADLDQYYGIFLPLTHYTRIEK